MKDRRSVWRLTCARVVAAGMAIALAPLPLAAAEVNPSAPSSIDLQAAVRKVVATERLAPNTVAQAPAQAGSAPNLQSPSFFKTPLGLAVIAVVGAGSAYAVYSAQHDRIHSAAR